MLDEVDDEKVASTWQMMQQAFDRPEAREMLTKLTESKEDFLQLLEGVQNHRETMQVLAQCYEEGDWAKL